MRMAIMVIGLLLLAGHGEALDVGSQFEPPLATAYIMPDESSALGIRAAKDVACEMAETFKIPLPIPFAVRQWTQQENGAYVPGMMWQPDRSASVGHGHPPSCCFEEKRSRCAIPSKGRMGYGGIRRSHLVTIRNVR